MSKDSEETFLKKYIYTIRKHMKRSSSSPAMGETQIHSHNEVLLHTHQEGYNKKAKNIKGGEDVGQLKPSCTAGGNVSWHIWFGKQSSSSSKG